MDEDGRPVLGQDYIGPPRKLPIMQAKAISRPVKERSEFYLGGGVVPAYAGHVPTAVCCRDLVGHHWLAFVLPRFFSIFASQFSEGLFRQYENPLLIQTALASSAWQAYLVCTAHAPRESQSYG